MVTHGKRVLGLLLTLAAGMSSGCGSSNESPREESAQGGVRVGDDYFANMELSNSGRVVEVGGDYGLVLSQPLNATEDDR